jgi:hypothetical protein
MTPVLLIGVDLLLRERLVCCRAGAPEKTLLLSPFKGFLPNFFVSRRHAVPRIVPSCARLSDLPLSLTVCVYHADFRHLLFPILVGSDSPRPLSKIRSNFVAVNKNGQLGLALETNLDSTTESKPNSLEANNIPPMSSSEAGEDSAEELQKLSSSGALTALPSTPTPRRRPPHDQVIASEEVSNMLSSSGTDDWAGLTASDASTSLDNAIITSSPRQALAQPVRTEEQPPMISNAPKVEIGPAVKATKPETKPLSQTPRDRRVKPAPSETKAKPSTASRPFQSRAGVDRTIVHDRLTTKSPSRQVKSSSVMAPTASSGAKLDASWNRQNRQHAVAHLPSTTERSSSRSSVSTRGASRRMTNSSDSVSQNPRPSVGPPPKKTAERPKPAKETHVDQDFLARMMRPTQASSSKTSEKAPVTPPRKPPAQRPSSSLAQVKPRTSSATKSRTPSRKPAIEKPQSPAIPASASDLTTDGTSQPTTVPPTDLNLVPDTEESRSAGVDHDERDAPSAPKTTLGLEAPSRHENTAGEATVTHSEEKDTNALDPSPSRHPNLDPLEAEVSLAPA